MPCPHRLTFSSASRTISACSCTIPASGATAAIDAPEAGPVEAALKATGWRLTDILVTHHHGDHTGGIAELKQRHKCRVVAPRGEAGAHSDWSMRPCARATTSGRRARGARASRRPGHTAGHITYWFPADKLAFVGDTLFSIGCGRVIEGTPEMMWQSLLKLRELPGDTRIYCGHEYTLANIRFAQTIEPDNTALAAREQEVDELVAAQASRRSPRCWARRRRPIRSCAPTCRRSRRRVGMAGQPAAEVFAEIRERKNKF